MDTQMNFNFSNLTRILLGVGQLNNLHKQQLPGKKALLLISNGKSTKVNGSFDRTADQLKKAGVDYVVFAKIMEFPPERIIITIITKHRAAITNARSIPTRDEMPRKPSLSSTSR